MVQISLVCCSFNPNRDYLLRTIRSMFAQKADSSICEIIIVDNRSEPPIASWLPEDVLCKVRIVVEPEAGLTPARAAGVRESRGEWVLFVDDDNVLDENYVGECEKIIVAFPQLGAFGSSKILPEFAVQPSGDLSPFLPLLAIRDQEKSMWSNVGDHRTFPCGAGMCARRDLMLEHFKCVLQNNRRKSLDRSGKSLASAGDTDMLYSVIDSGLGTGVFPSLQLLHLIPEGRIQVSYLCRLTYSISRSLTILEQERSGIRYSLAGKLKETVVGLLRVLAAGTNKRMAWYSQKGRLSALWEFK